MNIVDLIKSKGVLIIYAPGEFDLVYQVEYDLKIC